MIHNNTLHTLVCAALMLLVTFVSAMAQTPDNRQQDGRQRGFDPREFEQRMEKAITKHAQLSPEEAEAFFPLYKECRDKQRHLGRQIMKLKRTSSDNEQDYAAAIVKIRELEVQQAQLEQEYAARYLKVLPPRKLFRIFQGEDEFHRRLVQGRQGPDQSRQGPQAPQGRHPSAASDHGQRDKSRNR